MDFETLKSARKAELERLSAEIGAAGAQFVHVHSAETNGVFRTKTTPFKLSTKGDALNGILFCVGHSDGQPIGVPVFPSAIASDDNGYPNIMALADPASVRHHGWDRRFASVITDAFELDGSPCPLDPRHALRAQEARAAAMGFETRFALEFEFGLFHADFDLMRAGRYRELKPYGHSYVNYDLLRAPDYQDLVAELMTRLASVGVEVTSFVTEYGYGMYEFALGPKPALEAADDAMRAKLHLKELATERGLVATFMTRFQPPGKESACGGHHHQSLWRDDENLFAAGVGKLTDVARHYLAGLLARLPDSHLLFRPTVNSYRRRDRGAWSPEDVSWGFENRTAAIRAITTPNAGAARFEHRVPGADVNPYMTLTAMLAAGLDGIEAGLEPPPPAIGLPDPVLHTALTATLRASIDDFRASPFIERVFGAAFRDHYVASRLFEADAFDAWAAATITDFEWQRYFIGT